MKTLRIKNIVLGEGEPKICVPIVACNLEEIKQQANNIVAGYLPVDLIELRIDYLERYDDVEYISNAVRVLKKITDKPVILTFRTGFEGGRKDISRDMYVKLLIHILKKDITDILDVELFTGDNYLMQIVNKAHECNVKVIMSNHDFNNTPSEDEILSRLVKMDKMGADIVKIAVMPKNSEDVLKLMTVTEKAKAVIDKPVVTMSMSGAGLISRLSGEIFGSAVTFGAAGEASAPGQIDVKSLKYVLELIHNNYSK